MRQFIILLIIMPIYAFQSLYQNVYDWIITRSDRYSIDDSHNHVHSREVLAHYLALNRERAATEEMHQCSVLGCMLHDMMDKKYLPEQVGLDDILLFLSAQKVNEKIIDALAVFLPSVSYSETVWQKNEELVLDVPARVVSHEYYPCYEAIRASDLISSFNLQRTLLYHLKKGGRTATTREAFHHLAMLYESRMDKLIKYNIIPEWAHEYSIPIHLKSKQVLERVSKNLTDDTSFRKLYYACFIYQIPEWEEIRDEI